MNRVIPLITGLTVLTSTALAEPVSVTLEGVEARGGILYVGVQTEDQFMQQGGIAGDIIREPTSGTLTFDFDLPEGTYALSVWHDIDSDDQFDVDETGRPTDGWAMINGTSLRGEPRFYDVSFTVDSDGATVSEAMIYPAP
ncbi:MAG: DUF2141 domain-containing protein [Pseudomonadota bacterium]